MNNKNILIIRRKKKKNRQNQKGSVPLFLTIVIMSILLIIVLAVSLIILKQIKMSGDIGKTIIAYQAADSGIEYCLSRYSELKPGEIIISDFGLAGDEEMCDGGNVKWFSLRSDTDPDCDKADSVCFCIQPAIASGDVNVFKAIGRHSGVQRAIEVDNE